jgi:hypothetical protein
MTLLITDYKDQELFKITTQDFGALKDAIVNTLNFFQILHEQPEKMFKRMTYGNEYTYRGVLYKAIINL